MIWLQIGNILFSLFLLCIFFLLASSVMYLIAKIKIKLRKGGKLYSMSVLEWMVFFAKVSVNRDKKTESLK